MTYSAYAVTTPGLEEIVSAELAQLGITVQPEKKRPAGEPGEDFGGVAFTASLDQVYQANLHLRCASRIIIRVGEFDAVGFDELRRKAAQISWDTYLKPGVDVAIRATCRKSRLYHSDAVAREMVKAISQKLGTTSALVKPSEEGEKPAQLIIVRIVNDHCTVSIDSSGELLHRRGYRLETAKAPLRETLAAGLVLLTGWQPEYPLLDPFCGSGTIPSKQP